MIGCSTGSKAHGLTSSGRHLFVCPQMVGSVMNEWMIWLPFQQKNKNEIILIINYLQLPLEAGWSNVCQTNDWSALKDWCVMRPTGIFFFFFCLDGVEAVSAGEGSEAVVHHWPHFFFARELLCSAAAVEVNNKFSILFGKTGLALLPTADQIGNYKKKNKVGWPTIDAFKLLPSRWHC